METTMGGISRNSYSCVSSFAVLDAGMALPPGYGQSSLSRSWMGSVPPGKSAKKRRRLR